MNYAIQSKKDTTRNKLLKMVYEKQTPREDFLTPQQKETLQIKPYISTQNQRQIEMFNILKTNMSILQEDTTMKIILNKTKIIKSKRQPPHLKRPIRSELKGNKINKITVCNNPRCGLCGYILERTSFNFNGRTFYVKASMNCEVRNVIYAPICNGCGQYYIGQTGDKLRNRRTVHEQQMRDP